MFFCFLLVPGIDNNKVLAIYNVPGYPSVVILKGKYTNFKIMFLCTSDVPVSAKEFEYYGELEN